MKKSKKTIFRNFIVIIILLIGLYNVPLAVMGPKLQNFPGGIGDGTLNNYFLENGFLWITGSQDSFWDAPFFYPATNVLAFSDNHLGTLPFYTLFRLFHINKETSFQLWFLTIFILNYVSCFWVIKRLSNNVTASIAGAFIFTFSLPIVAQLGHAQLLPRFCVPLSFYFLIRYFDEKHLKFLMGFLFFIIWQFYCTIYIGFFLILVLVIFISIYLLLHINKYELIEILWGSKTKFFYGLFLVVGAIVFLLPLFLPYYKISKEYDFKASRDVFSNLPRIQSYLSPTPSSLLWKKLEPAGDNLPLPWEHQMFIGMFPWIAALIATINIFKKDKDEFQRVESAAILSMFVSIVVTLKWNGFSLYKIVLMLPGTEAINVVSRIIMVFSFLFGILIGAFYIKIQNLISIKKTFIGNLIPILFLSIIVIDQSVIIHPYHAKNDIQQRSHELAQEVMKKNHNAQSMAYMPKKSNDPFYVIHNIAMSAAQILHIPTINGYSGNIPAGYDFLLNYDEYWALKKWQVLSKAKYEKHYRNKSKQKYDTLFDNLVIIGSPKGMFEDKPISIAFFPLTNKGYNAEINPPKKNIVIKPKQKINLPIKVINNSREIWPALGDFSGKNKIGLSYRWLTEKGEELIGFNPRFPLHYDLLPGEEFIFNVEITALDQKGNYFVEFDLVQESVAWFSSKGSQKGIINIMID